MKYSLLLFFYIDIYSRSLIEETTMFRKYQMIDEVHACMYSVNQGGYPETY